MAEYLKKVDLLSAAVEVEYLGRPRMMVSAAKIGMMPGVEIPDRPQGEWIDKGKNLWKCSNCEMVIYSESEQDRNEFHKWCSRCGCRMKGADDEDN